MATKKNRERRAGTPSNEETVARDEADDSAEDELLSPELPKPKKRGRPSNAAQLEVAPGNQLGPTSEIERPAQNPGVQPQTAGQPPRKKRGRPSDAERAARAERAQEQDEPPQLVRRKRGRPSDVERATRLGDAEQDTDEQPQPVRRKRGRPSDVERATRLGDAEQDTDEQPQPVRRKRGRPSDVERATRLGDAEQDTDEQPQPVRRKRGRPSDAERAARAELDQKLEVPLPAARRKRGRPSNAERGAVSAENLEQQSERQTKQRKRIGRPKANSDDDLEDRSIDQPARRKRGRPSNADRAAAEFEEGSETRPVQKKRGRLPRPEQIEPGDEVEQQSEVEAPTKKRKRRLDLGDSEQDSLEGAEDARPPKYQHLAAVQHNIPRQTIDAKWNPLPRTAVERIGQLFQDVQRSIVMRIRQDGRRTQASTALQLVIDRIRRKVIRLPFPPSTRQQPEEDFDLEKILDRSSQLESRLTPLLHSIALLKAENRKEERLLEVETSALNTLEANAKADASRRKTAARKLHPVLRDNSYTEVEHADVDGSLLQRSSQLALSNTITADDGIKPVITELHSHLESIRSNVTQVEGLSSAMAVTRAAVQDVLFKHLDMDRYEHVVLG